MKKSFIESLVGMTESEARVKVIQAGLSAYVVPDGVAVALASVPRAVVLVTKDNKIVHASPGDLTELES